MATTTSSRGDDDGGYEVVKWYTRARRFPQLIGKTPDGATIWGGPYTYTQVIVGVSIIVVGSKTTWLWGHFGLIGNAVILLGVAYGLVLVLGRLPIGSRNPMAIASGALRALSSPSHGRLGGSPVRIRRPRRARSRLVISETPATAPSRPSSVAAATSSERSRPRFPRPRWSRPAPSQRPPVAASPSMRPTPATHPRSSETPALTGVQRLLASSGARQED
ncbi:MAG: hypothetical protein ACRCYU_20605 [Nocardioides sp.]